MGRDKTTLDERYAGDESLVIKVLKISIFMGEFFLKVIFSKKVKKMPNQR